MRRSLRSQERAPRAGRRGRRGAGRRRPPVRRIEPPDRVVTSQTLTFMPADDAVSGEPEGDELAARGIAAEDDPVPGAGEAGVLHADVVLVGEEVRQAVVGIRADRACCGRRPGPGAARWPSARRGCAPRRTGGGRWPRRRRRTRPARWSAGARRRRSRCPRRCPARAASSVRGSHADADDDEVAVERRGRRWCERARPPCRPRRPRRRCPAASARRGRRGCRGRWRRPRRRARARAGPRPARSR